jgi:hypothetical protein
MSRVARVTEDLGRRDGGFYIEPPDIPEGMTCQDWRRRRTEIRTAERSSRPPHIAIPRLGVSQPALRPRLA